MPFQNAMRSYTLADVLSLNLNQNGVYGIFLHNNPIYIGSGDIRARLFAHLNGYVPCITRNNPNQWTGEVFSGDPAMREGELIREYKPICNEINNIMHVLGKKKG